MRDFDEFWREQRADVDPEQFRVRGRTYTLPVEAPATLVLRMARLSAAHADGTSIPDTVLEEIASEVLGRDTLDQMLDDGLTARELTDLLAWATPVLMGQRPAGDGGTAEGSGSSPTVAPPSSSVNGGASSKRTSPASTESIHAAFG